MNCYVPMLEKLKAVVIAKDPTNSNNSVKSIQDKTTVVTANDIQKLYPNEILHQEDPNLPKRGPNGLTFTQNIGVFPRQVSLEIRHTHPSLGLREVADVRKHSDQNQMSVQYQNVNKNPKGVLSLGLPPQMVPKGFTTMAKRPPQSAPSEAICHYYETLNPKYANVVSMQRQKKKPFEVNNSNMMTSSTSMQITEMNNKMQLQQSSDLDMTLKTTDSGQVSGGSSIGSHSPTSAEQGGVSEQNLLPPTMRGSRTPPTLAASTTALQKPQRHPASLMPPNTGPPPRHLLPAKLKPSPGVKMHPVILDFKEIADNASLSVEETGSSATESTDSIGSLRNSSPENAEKCVMREKNRSSDAMSRLSPMVTGNATSLKLQKQILNYSAEKHKDLGYHTLMNTCSTSSLESSDNLWDVRATKTPIRDLKLMTHNAKHSPVSRSSTPRSTIKMLQKVDRTNSFAKLPDSAVLRILSYLSTNDLVRCSRLSRRFYFLSWEPELWRSVVLTGEEIDADLALKTIFRLLNRNAIKHGLDKLVLNGCSRLTDRGLAMVARTCPQLSRLEIQHCVNITNGGLMDLVTKCQMLDHLDVTGCHMISTIKVHQPPPTPNPATRGATTLPTRRLEQLQYLDLTDCTSLEDTGLKMVVESCPQLLYLFMRRCTTISDIGIKYVASYCLQLRELSISDCSQITDFGLYELAKLGPNLRYLSVAKCDQISDSGVKQIARLCYKLRYLNVRGCEAVSDEAIEMLARSCSRLRSLDIGKCDVTDVGLKMLSENCPNLKKLSVKSCEMVSNHGIQSVAYYCRGLQQLNIQDTPITLDGYRTVKKFCKRCIIEHSHPGFF